MTRIPVESLKDVDFSLLKGGESITVTVHGVDVAVLVDPELLDKIEDYFDAQQTAAEAAEAESEGYIAWDAAKRQLGL